MSSIFRSIRNLSIKHKNFTVFRYFASSTQNEILRKSYFYEQNKRWLSLSWKIAGVALGAFLFEFHYHNKLFATSKSMDSFQSSPFIILFASLFIALLI